MTETWRPVVGYEGRYEVSDQGRVRSLDRVIHYMRNGDPRTQRWPGRLLSPSRNNRGYPQVSLGYNRTHLVHWLVAAAFIGPRPDGLVVCHNNGDQTDNRPENLRYDTLSGNMQDSVRHGTNRNARKTHCVNGHEFTPENTGSNQGRRRCLTCHRKRENERYHTSKVTA